ncbi:hypothetical protein SESBI_02021 [Sesbania bispinosa]|nr:hypothetical protein SESBI_02021 [Sesbania bispinosa]
MESKKNPNYQPPFQTNAYVKWWTQFDSSKASPNEAKLLFQNNPKYLKQLTERRHCFSIIKQKIEQHL